MRRVVRALNRSGLKYLLTGALATSYYGRPRTTLDIDVVVAAKEKDLATLARALGFANLKVEEPRLEAAWRSKYRITTFEDRKSPHTLDIIFTDGRLERKSGSILGLHTFYQTAESLVLAKLKMIKATIQRERAMIDREDIKAILKGSRIDLKRLRRRAKAQTTSEILEDLLCSSGL